MSDIAPLHRPAAAAYTPAGRPTPAEPAAAGAARGSDQIEFSDTAKILAKLADLPEVRQDLVSRVRAEIEAGTYETPDKLDAAVENLAQDLA
jgi:hypothetical protein